MDYTAVRLLMTQVSGHVISLYIFTAWCDTDWFICDKKRKSRRVCCCCFSCFSSMFMCAHLPPSSQAIKVSPTESERKSHVRTIWHSRSVSVRSRPLDIAPHWRHPPRRVTLKPRRRDVCRPNPGSCNPCITCQRCTYVMRSVPPNHNCVRDGVSVWPRTSVSLRAYSGGMRVCAHANMCGKIEIVNPVT